MILGEQRLLASGGVGEDLREHACTCVRVYLTHACMHTKERQRRRAGVGACHKGAEEGARAQGALVHGVGA